MARASARSRCAVRARHVAPRRPRPPCPRGAGRRVRPPRVWRPLLQQVEHYAFAHHGCARGGHLAAQGRIMSTCCTRARSRGPQGAPNPLRPPAHALRPPPPGLHRLPQAVFRLPEPRNGPPTPKKQPVPPAEALRRRPHRPAGARRPRPPWHLNRRSLTAAAAGWRWPRRVGARGSLADALPRAGRGASYLYSPDSGSSPESGTRSGIRNPLRNPEPAPESGSLSGDPERHHPGAAGGRGAAGGL